MALDALSALDASQKSSNVPSSDPNSAAQSATLNYNDFLQLLIAEMKTQDPTAPTDPTAQISQLASFSQAEQQIQSNTKLDSIISQANLQIAQDYSGKYVSTTVDDKTIEGVISTVKVYSDGVIATLEDGTQVLSRLASPSATKLRQASRPTDGRAFAGRVGFLKILAPQNREF